MPWIRCYLGPSNFDGAAIDSGEELVFEVERLWFGWNLRGKCTSMFTAWPTFAPIIQLSTMQWFLASFARDLWAHRVLVRGDYIVFWHSKHIGKVYFIIHLKTKRMSSRGFKFWQTFQDNEIIHLFVIYIKKLSNSKL